MAGLGIRRRLHPVLRPLRARRRAVRRWIWRARLDFRDYRDGTRDPLIPPRRKGLPSQIGAIGERLASTVIEAGAMAPAHAVLDIGCGSGRVAAPLTRYLDPAAGSYEGFDVMRPCVRWCRRAISARHPNFRFQVADVHNAQYNPGAQARAGEYRFPYEDASFDLAFASSLFTHLRPFETQHYLAEVARVLKPGGRLVGTWFLLNDESERFLAAGSATGDSVDAQLAPALRLEHELTDERGFRFRCSELEVPEHRIAIYATDAAAWHEQAGLRVREVRPGRWPGRELPADALGQDLIVAALA